MEFTGSVPLLDCVKALSDISSLIQREMLSQKRDGIVIGMSGGVDSALCLRLCVEAAGSNKVFGLMLPEKESSRESKEYALSECNSVGIKWETIDITNSLVALGAYRQRDDAIREVFPEYDGSQKSKMVLPGDILRRDSFNFYSLVIQGPEGKIRSSRLNNSSFRKIASANNLKQRTRMLYLYRTAEERNYLVCGTTNRTEFIQGFFVKYGDGGVDIEPIVSLYKTQVYQLSRHVGVLAKIISRTPTPDTFSLETSDEEFYFRIPYEKLDVFLYAWEKKVPALDVAKILGYSVDQVSRVYRDLSAKYNATRHLRALPPSLELNEL